MIHHVAFLGPDYQGENDDIECKERTFYQEATILKQSFQGTSNSCREFGVIKHWKFGSCTLDNWKSFKIECKKTTNGAGRLTFPILASTLGGQTPEAYTVDYGHWSTVSEPHLRCAI